MLAALGSAAVGGATAVSTGAFTSVEANRSVSVSVADDSDALLALDQSSAGPNSEYATVSDGEVSIDIDNSDDGGGTGLNQNAVTNIFDIFRVRNQGTQPVAVHVPPESVSPASAGAADGNYDGFYVDPQFTGRPNGGYDQGAVSATVVYYLSGGEPNFTEAAQRAFDDSGGVANYVLGVGQSVEFGLYLDTEESAPDEDIGFDIKASAEQVPDGFST
jgi:hypothetical protein